MADTHTKIDCIRWEDGEVYDINLPRTATPHITALGVDEKILTGDAGLPESGYTIIDKGTVKVKPASTETKPQLDLLSANQNSTAEISAQVKSQNADGYIVSDTSTLTLKGLGVVRGGDAVYNGFTISADYDGTQRIGDFLVKNKQGLSFLTGFKAAENCVFSKSVAVNGAIKCDEISSSSTTKPLKLPSIQVGGDIYSTKYFLQQHQMTIQFDNDEATIYLINDKVGSPSFVCSENLIIENIYSGMGKADGPFITLFNEGTDKSIKLTRPVKSSQGIVEESTIQASKFIETTPNMTSAVGASGAKYKANSPTTTNNIKLTYRNSEKEYVFDSTDSSSGDISTGGSVTSNILNLFNGFATMKIIYLNTAGENIFEYELPSVMYFDQTEEKKIPLLLPSFDATKEFTTEYRDSSGGTTYYNGSMTMNEGILDFRKSGTTTAYTMPYLKVARAGSSKYHNNGGPSMSGPAKITFWNPKLSGNNKYIDIDSIIIRVRKFN